MYHSKPQRIATLSEIGAMPPSEWQDRGRLYLEHKRGKTPFSYIIKNRIVYIHDFRTGEVSSFVPNGVVPDVQYVHEDEFDKLLSKEKQAEYNLMPVAVEHEYMIRKNIGVSYSVKKDQQGGLVIPMYNDYGEIASLQRIYAYGKRFEKGYPTKGLFYCDEPPSKEASIVWLSEGYATYRTLKKYLKFDGLCCFSKSNMLFMEKKLIECGWQVVVMHDLDDEQYKTSPPVISDWNDCEKICGPQKTKIYLEEAISGY